MTHPLARIRATRAAVGCAAVLAPLALGACVPPAPTADPCHLPTATATADAEAGPVLGLLVDARSPASDAAVAAVAADPAALFASPALGLAPEAADADGDATGVVMILSYGPTGDVRTIADIDLRGRGNDTTVEAADARTQIGCLTTASDELAQAAPVVPVTSAPASVDGADATTAPVPPVATGGDLFRALPRATEVVRGRADGRAATIVTTGLGRSQVAGIPLSAADLQEEARPEVLAQIRESGVAVPDLTSSDVGLVFLDPAEGLTNSIAAAGVAAFAGDLCTAMAPPRCDVTTVLGVSGDHR